MTRHVLFALLLGASALSCACRQPTPSPPVAAASSAPATGGLAGPPDGQARVPRQYLVTVAAAAGEAAVRELCGRFGITALKLLGNDVYLVTLAEDPGLATLEELGRHDARVRAVQPNLVYKAN